MKPLVIGQTITDRQDESLGMYFKDVSKQPLIDINEEIELSRRIKKGDKEALDKLVLANLRFAISVAKQYQNKGLSLVDLIQEANLGLYQAAKTFDESRGFRFISYAVWWIRQSIIKAISEQCRTVRVPMSQIACSNKIAKVSEKFEQLHGRKPSLSEIEEETNMDYDKLVSASAAINRSVSLDTPFKDEDAGCLLDVLPNERAEGADDSVVHSSCSSELDDILNRLPYRDRDVIRMSFGIGMDPMQNEEIANRFGIGCERVRQIKDSAIKYLKDNYEKELRELL